MKSTFTSVFFFLIFQACAQIGSGDLDAFVENKIKNLNIAGASLLVTQQGKTLLNKGYGFAVCLMA